MDKSSYYPVFLPQSSQEPNRLDYNYNSPKYNKIQELMSKSKIKTIMPIGNESPKILNNITSGKTPNDIKYLEEGVPFLGASNIQYAYIDSDSAPRISVEEHETRLRSSQIKKGNVLITIAGVGLGRCAVYSSDEECNCNQAVAVLELNTDAIVPEYLMYYLNSEIGQLFFGKMQHQADQPNINLEEIKSIMVVLPEEPEQKNIVEKCSKIQTEILRLQEELKRHRENFDEPMREGLKRKATHYDRLYKSNYYSILPEDMENKRHRLDFVANHPLFNWIRDFRESKGVIPLEKLIVPERFSYGLSESACESGDVGFLNVQHLSFEGRIVFDPQTFLKDCPLEKRLKKNDILIARTGHTLGKAALITEDYEGFTFGSFCIRFSLNSNDYLPDFIAQFINSIYGQAQIMLLKAGAGKNNINQDHIRDIRIPIIDEEPQREILGKYHESLKKLMEFETQLQTIRNKLSEQFMSEILQ